MAYIRSKKEELTGYQASGEIRPSVDLGCDFIMVYGIDPTMPGENPSVQRKGLCHPSDDRYRMGRISGISGRQVGWQKALG